jgi:HSP20 family protein
MFSSFPGPAGSVFDQFRRLQEEMDELFGQWSAPMGIRSLPRGSFPAVNVGASPDRLEVYVFIPGVDPKRLDISVQQNLLTLSGERNIAPDEKANYYRQERFSGEFRRAITLPEDVATDGVDAQYRDGVLQITIPRREQAQPRQIQVR